MENVVTADEDRSEGFGLTLRDLTPEIASRLRVPVGTSGGIVVRVERGSSSEQSGIQTGDVIISVNRVNVTNSADTISELNQVESGRTAFLLVQRGDTRIFMQVLKE